MCSKCVHVIDGPRLQHAWRIEGMVCYRAAALCACGLRGDARVCTRSDQPRAKPAKVQLN
eukprot:5331658-Prymnesium_polylepis.1